MVNHLRKCFSDWRYEDMLSRVVAISVAAIVCCIGVAMVSNTPAHARSAGECVNDHWGPGTLGSGDRRTLQLGFINESQWNGSGSYAAVRYLSDGTVTYDQPVSSGYWEYGTSGNANRKTEFLSESFSSMTAYVEQDNIC
jgi:hypothetical protein